MADGFCNLHRGQYGFVYKECGGIPKQVLHINFNNHNFRQLLEKPTFFSFFNFENFQGIFRTHPVTPLVECHLRKEVPLFSLYKDISNFDEIKFDRAMFCLFNFESFFAYFMHLISCMWNRVRIKLTMYNTTEWLAWILLHHQLNIIVYFAFLLFGKIRDASVWTQITKNDHVILNYNIARINKCSIAYNLY